MFPIHLREDLRGNSGTMESARNTLVVLAVAVLTLSAHQQEGIAKKAEVRPSLGRSQTLIEEWNEVGRKLTAMAEDFPEDKYDFKPTPAQRSFNEQLLHAANANYLFVNSATGQKPPAEDPKREEYKTKRAVVQFVKKSFADGAAVIQGRGDAGIDDLLTDPFSKKQVRLSDMVWSLLEHSGEHYGQLVVYYRAAGLVPPESRVK